MPGLSPFRPECPTGGGQPRSAPLPDRVRGSCDMAWLRARISDPKGSSVRPRWQLHLRPCAPAGLYVTLNPDLRMEAAIFDDLTALADATRSRMLLVLERQELTVGELCTVLQLPQSTVSRHLKTLSDAGWVSSRRDGTSRYYTLALDERGHATRRLWTLLREQVSLTNGADQDARRLKGVLSRRQTASQEFFSSAAGRWDRLRAEMFGAASYLQALPGLLDESWVVGDLGCGTGQVAAALAPFVSKVVAVDRSGEMLQTARRRLRDFANVDVRRGELEALPLDNHALDAATLLLVLHHVPDPGAALREAARVLRARRAPARSATCFRTIREEYRQQMGHVWLGFGEDQLRKLLAGAGFEKVRMATLAADPSAKGPALFVAGARSEIGGSVTSRLAESAAGSWQLGAGASHQVRGFNEHSSSRDASIRRSGQGGARALQGQESRRGRVRTEGDPARRAGDARTDGAARPLQGQEAAGRREGSWAACT